MRLGIPHITILAHKPVEDLIYLPWDLHKIPTAIGAGTRPA